MRSARDTVRSILALGLASAVLAGFAEGAAAFDGIRVTLLGSGRIAADGEIAGPSAVVEAGEEVLLFDCGRATLQRLRQAGIDPAAVSGVFLSALDERRLAGCDELWRARMQQDGGGPLPVWGPPGTRELFRRMADGLQGDQAGGELAFDITDNIVYQPEGVTVTAFVTDPSREGREFGYRVDADRRAVAITGDGRATDNVVRYARGAQLMLHEVAGSVRPPGGDTPVQSQLAAGRTAPEEAGRLFQAARPYLAVYSHIMLNGLTEEDLVQRTRRTYRGPLQLGRDLMVIEVQNEVQIRSAPSEPRSPR